MNNNHTAAGTPRGFNLATMPPLTFMPGFNPQPGFPSFNFGHHTVQAPGGWAGGVVEDTHQPGPMRRGGRFQNNNRPGPYDRRGGGYRGNGRLSPPRGQMGGKGGAGKWGDGVGAQTVGPREAVQGRSLKSYEDLDAVGGGGGGELNY